MQINRQTYEEYFLLYIDGELNAGERAEVENFVNEHPELKEELTLLGQSVFVADESIAFENKEVLYRQEKDRAVFIFSGWRKIAVAAAVLLFLGAGGWLYVNKKTTETNLNPPVVAETKLPSKPSAGNKTIAATEQPKARALAEVHKIKNNSKIMAAGNHAVKTKIKERTVIDESNRDEEITLRERPGIIDEVAEVNNSHQEINIPVRARSVAVSVVTSPPDPIVYSDGDNLSGDNKIYFANTSFSKKNNLRVVFRKASRIIDRITTLQ